MSSLRLAIAIVVPAGCAAPPPPSPPPVSVASPSASTPPAPASASSSPSTELPGAKLFARLSCTSCHSVTGELMVGPRLDGWFGGSIELSDGSVVTANEAYFRESLLAPRSPRCSRSSRLKPRAGCAGYRDNYMAAASQKEHRCVRDILLPKLSAGTLTSDEASFLREACMALGDTDCAARALKKM